jgi:multiple sugar transport system ATP-binding protein
LNAQLARLAADTIEANGGEVDFGSMADFDCPSYNADVQARGFPEGAEELHRRLEATVVYVTHDQVEAMTMGHRIAIMNEGVLQQVGPPQDVYDRPANVFVARFIGSPAMNTFAGRVDDSRTNVVVRSGAGALPMPPGVERKAGTVVTIGVRPEAFRIADDGPIKANVTLVESLGHERQVLCRLEGGTDIVIVRLAADAPAPDDGDAITLTARAVDIHLFDDETGDRLG